MNLRNVYGDIKTQLSIISVGSLKFKIFMPLHFTPKYKWLENSNTYSATEN